MKNYLMLLFCLGLSSFTMNSSEEISEEYVSNFIYNLDKLSTDSAFLSHFDNFDIEKAKRLIAAILWQESSNGNKKYLTGDGGKAKGILQQHTCIIQDVNEYLGEDRYTEKDRNDPVKAIEIFLYYQAKCGNKKLDPEMAARIWNGGPKGYEKASTLSYWKKIQEWMNDETSMKNSLIHDLPILKQNYQV